MAGQASRMVKTGFSGFPAEGMQFFRSLARNNRREWFQPRKQIDDEQLKALMGNLQGEQLSRVPKGFPCDHAAADLLRYKQWLFFVMLDPALATTPKLLAEIRKRFESMMPFLELLNEPLVRAAKRPKIGF